jgi:hypothetical protein
VRNVAKPLQPAADVLEECAVTIANVELRDRLGLAADDIRLAEHEYVQHGQIGELFRLVPTDGINGYVSTEEMVWVYDNKLSRQGNVARRIYDAIKAAPAYGICPLCGHRIVATLDHYLSKARHPLYAVTPSNLVPACTDCNKLKLNRQPAHAEDQTFHPYFDNVSDGLWLKATLIESLRPAVIFFPEPPAVWNAIKRARIVLHFQTFHLAELYAANAAQELAGLRHELVIIAEAADQIGVQNHLIVRAASRAALEQNSWQAAMYRALSQSEWFWNGGYVNIPRQA